MRSDKAGRSQTAATALQMLVAAPVRARIIKIQADRLGKVRAAPARSGLRALPYSLRLWCEGLTVGF